MRVANGLPMKISAPAPAYVRWNAGSTRSAGTRIKRASAATHHKFSNEVGRLRIRETAYKAMPTLDRDTDAVGPMNAGASAANASSDQSDTRGAPAHRNANAITAAASAICNPEKTSRW